MVTAVRFRRRARRRLLPVLLSLAVVAGSLVTALATATAASGWSAPVITSLTNTDEFAQMISCPVPSHCVAVDTSGDVVTYNGTAWSSAELVDTGAGFVSVSCAATSFDCTAVDEAGNAFTTSDGAHWSGPVFTGASNNAEHLTAVSCWSATDCVAVDREGNDYIETAGVWAGPTAVDATVPANFLIAISCPTADFCVAVDKNLISNPGYAFVYDGSAWTTDQINPANTRALAGVSCASSTFCEAIDTQGNAHEYDGTTWQPPATLLADDSLDGISCPTATFCTAVDEDGNAFTDSAGSWSPRTFVDTEATSDNIPYEVACTSATFCVLLDTYSYSFFSNDAPSLVLTPSPLPATPNAVTYTVTLTGNGSFGVPTGNVTISDGGPPCTVSVWTPAPGPDAETGACPLTEVAPGPDTVTASYPGDVNFSATATTVTATGAEATAGSASITTTDPTVTTAGGSNSTDTVTESDYPVDPVGGLTDGDGTDFFDVTLSPGTTFTSVVLQDCDLSSTATMSWWDPSANSGAGGWAPVVGNPGPTNTGGCISVTLENTPVDTMPDLTQLTGTVFGIAHNLDITTASSLPGGRAHQPYRATLQAVGGNAPLKWAVTAGALPRGLHLHKATGLISGRPNGGDSGTSTFTVTLTDKKIRTAPHTHTHNTVSRVFTLAIV